MAYENLGKVVNIFAAEDLSAKQFRFVKLNSSGKATLSSLGADAIGVLQDDPDALDKAAAVMIGSGITKVVAGAATHAGFGVMSDSTGRAVDSATGDAVLGFFLEAASAAGDIVSMLFRPAANVR